MQRSKPIPPARRFFRCAVLRIERILRSRLARVPADHQYFTVELIIDHGPGDELGVMYAKLTSCPAPKGQPVEQVALEVPVRRVNELLEALGKFDAGEEMIH